MVIDILLSLLGYAGTGMVTARQAKIHMENVLHRENLTAGRVMAHAWDCESKGSRMGTDYHDRPTCHECDQVGVARKSMERRWEHYSPMGWQGVAVVYFGLFWPLGVTGWLTGRLVLAVGKRVEPALDYFFENPRIRKERRNKVLTSKVE